MTMPVLRRTLGDSTRALMGWAIGILAVLGLYLPIFSTFSSDQMQSLLAGMPQGLIRSLGYDQISTGAGYTQATFYGLMGFALLTIAGVTWGSAGIAGAWESGRLELVLAHGVGRVGFALQQALAVVARLGVLVLWTAVIVLVLNHPSQLGLDLGHVIAASLALWGLASMSAMVALAAGALTGRRAVAVAVGAAVAVASYALNAVARQKESLEWLDRISPYGWAYHSAPLSNGFDAVGLIALWVAAAACCAVAVVGLSRRDIT